MRSCKKITEHYINTIIKKIPFTPLIQNMGKDRASLEEQKQVQNKEELKEPSLFKVLLHNDDYTTMDFVIMILETVFNKDTTESTRIMLNIHNQGVGIAGVYTREIGETKISLVHEMARKYQFPLKCSLEKVNL